MKHKHYDTLIAFANGFEVQIFDKEQNTWINAPYPSFIDWLEYRIKPESKPDVFLHIAATPRGFGSTSTGAFPAANLKLTFCGETGALKNAEVLE